MGYDLFRRITGEMKEGKEGLIVEEKTTPSTSKENGLARGLSAAERKKRGQLAEAERKKNDQIEARKYLMKPGPDMVVADEAHTIKV
jgi:hypothetical protein